MGTDCLDRALPHNFIVEFRVGSVPELPVEQTSYRARLRSPARMPVAFRRFDRMHTTGLSSVTPGVRRLMPPEFSIGRRLAFPVMSSEHDTRHTHCRRFDR